MVGNRAVYNYPKYNILPSLVIAQAILESNWGNSGLSKTANNLFGIKGTGSAGTTVMFTNEDDGKGNKYVIKAGFRKYNSVLESIDDHAKLLQNKRYSKVRSSTNILEASREIRLAGYATDTKYTTLIMSIVNQNDLERFDALVKIKPELKKDDVKMTEAEKKRLLELEEKVKELESIVRVNSIPAWAYPALENLPKDTFDKTQLGGRDLYRLITLIDRLIPHLTDNQK